MFLRPKIIIDEGLYRQAKAKSIELGYVSLDEYVTHLLERELRKYEGTNEADAMVLERLKGLGYIE
jgi:hypothetical protein